MLPVTEIQTNVSAEKDLLEMATSCVCLQSFLQFVPPAADPTVIALMEFQINVSVTVNLEGIRTKDAHHQPLILYKTASVEVTPSVSPMEPVKSVPARKALMEILSLGVLTSMNAPIKSAERMLFASTPLETMTVGVNSTTKETPSRLAFPSNPLLLICVQKNNVAQMLFVLLVNAFALQVSKGMPRI